MFKEIKTEILSTTHKIKRMVLTNRIQRQTCYVTTKPQNLIVEDPLLVVSMAEEAEACSSSLPLAWKRRLS